MKYLKDDKVYYQNNEARFVSYLTEKTVVIVVSLLPDFSFDPSGMCQGCLIGDNDNKISCTCEEAEFLMEEIEGSTKETLLPLVVDINTVYDKPMIVQQHEDSLQKIQDKKTQAVAEVNSLEMQMRDVKMQIKDHNKSLEGCTKKIEALDSDIHTRQEALTKINVNIGEARQRLSGLEDGAESLEGSSDGKELAELRKMEFKMNCLENGGIDNWEWYGESLKEYYSRYPQG